MEQVTVTIIGAGAVGLAVAAELSALCESVVVVEQHARFGQETSSRNSEVIHAGIYYPPESAKARLCIEGNALLYAYCAAHSVAYRRVGKLIVAWDQTGCCHLDALFDNARQCGLRDLRMLGADEIHAMEPRINAMRAIFSPSTGIFDTHGFMKSLETQTRAQGGELAYGTRLEGIEPHSGGYMLRVTDTAGEAFVFNSRIVVNAAGLNAHTVASMAGITARDYTIHYCKGDYFRVGGNKAGLINHLIYPPPAHDHVSLGIHTALDLAGGLRLGPDAAYVEAIDYAVDARKRDAFYGAVREFLPFIAPEDLTPDTSGIRAKLQGPHEPARDFIIGEETERGLRGFINLVGIDSPGLTSSLAIARQVKKYVVSLL